MRTDEEWRTELRALREELKRDAWRNAHSYDGDEYRLGMARGQRDVVGRLNELLEEK